MTSHRRIDVDGIDTFYRVDGPAGAPVLLLPHGYPSSSFQFRGLMPALADRWRTVAPDLPGFGFTATPPDFGYTFDAYARFLDRFTEVLGLTRYAIYLQDYGSQHGLRLALAHPERVAGLIIQNGDIYPEHHGPKYAPLHEFWDDPTPEGRAKLTEAVSLDGFRDEFRGEVPDGIADRISPDLWTLAWSVMTPERREHLTTLLADQRHTRDWFGPEQAYLREHQPPTLIVWGPHDGYMPEDAARAYLTDLPQAELHLLDGGHWLLETHLPEVVSLIRPFLDRL